MTLSEARQSVLALLGRPLQPKTVIDGVNANFANKRSVVAQQSFAVRRALFLPRGGAAKNPEVPPAPPSSSSAIQVDWKELGKLDTKIY